VTPAAEGIGVRIIDPGELPRADELVAAWGSGVARLGELVETATLPILVAERDAELVGVLAFSFRPDGCEVVTIEAVRQGEGAGRSLMAAIVERAHAVGSPRVWLVTTNDNTRAIRFYQRLGMELSAVHLGAVDDARARLKPTIPLAGCDGIPIHDELVFELRLT
jgi:N-acetylglutamate synthase-like GNAT family acetyltransferase